MNIRLVTAVWGREFVEIFLRIGIRSLLAEGNALALAQAHQVTYTIFTTPEDREVLVSHIAFVGLCEGVDVQFSLFNLSEIDSANPSSHGIFWYRGIDLARRNREVLFFIMPDVLYARGTLLAWAQRFERGAKAVFTVGPRVTLETVLRDFSASSETSHQPLDFCREQLLDMLFRNMHPVHAVMARNSARQFAHPEYDLRIVQGRGVIIREMVSHPFCIEPSYFSRLRYFSPDDHVDSLAFEPCSTVSVEPLLKFVDQWYRPWPLDENHLSHLGGWWDWHNSRSCERESEHSFELLLGSESNGSMRAERLRGIAGGRFYRSQIIIAWRLFKLFRALREAGLRGAASLLAAAVYACRLRRRIFLRGGAILLVPTDAACAAAGGRLSELLLPGRESELVDLVRNHIILQCDEPSARQCLENSLSTSEPNSSAWYTARGERAEAQLSALGYAEPFSLDSFTIYPIDRVLWDGEVAAQPAIVEKRRQFDWRVVGVAVGRKLGRARPIIGAGMRRGTESLARATSRAAILCRDVPVIGRSTRLCSLVLLSTLQNGVSFTAKEIARRTGTARIVGPLLRFIGLFVRPVGSAFRFLRRHGVAASTAKATSKVSVAAKSIILPGHPPSDADRAILDDVRRLRALQAAEQVTADFVKRLDLRNRPSTLLDFLRAKLNELAKADGLPSEAAAKRLVRLTQKYPAWADAWLELGYVYQDEDRPLDALKCFERAMDGDLYGTVWPNAVAIAAANRGRHFAANGCYKEAATSFAFSLRHDPEQGLVSIEYADSLRRSGAPGAALEHYERGMCFWPPTWKLPPMPRDAATITIAPITGDNVPRKSRWARAAADDQSPARQTVKVAN